MESEFSDIFRVKGIAKISCLGHWGPKTKLFLQCDVSF